MSWSYPSGKKKRWSEKELIDLFSGSISTDNVVHEFYVPSGHGQKASFALGQVLSSILFHCGIRLGYRDSAPAQLIVEEVGPKPRKKVLSDAARPKGRREG